MRTKTSWFSSPILVLVTTLLPSLVRAGLIPESPPSAWNPGSFGVSATGEYFTSQANYDETRGSYTRLNNSNSFSDFETRARARYAFANAVSAYSGIAFAQSHAVDGSLDKTNGNVTEAFLGADFQLIRRWWRVIPEVEFSFPTDETKTNQTIPLTSDGTWFGRAGVFLFKPYKYFRMESYLGFQYPGNGLAKRFLYTLYAETAFASGFSFGGGIDGTESLLTDDNSNNQRITQQILADAGSHRYAAYNPSLIEARAWLGFRADKSFAFRLGYAKTLNGMRSAEGQSILLSVAYNSAGDKATGHRLREESQKHAEETFRTDPEQNDPQLFQNPDEDTPPPRAVPKKENLDETERILENRAQ